MRSVRISRVVAVREERVGWRGRIGGGCVGVGGFVVVLRCGRCVI